MKRLTFLFSATMVMLLVSCLIASPARAVSIVVRARGTTGTEQIRLTINNSIVNIWTLTTSFADYNACSTFVGNCKVKYFNDDDDDGKDVQVDYITMDGVILQAEDQAVNTGVWQNDQCGGSYSEWMNCDGYIDFGDVQSIYSISVSPTSLSVAAEANSTGTFDVNSNTDWTVSSNQTWLTVSPTSGSNNETVTVTAQENISTSPRTATVTVSGECITPKTVTVTQGPVLSVSPRWLVVAAEANVARSFDIYSSRSWTVSSDQNWLTVSPTSGSYDGTVTVTAEQNSDTSTRTATVTVSVTGASQTVTVIQMYTGDSDCNVLPPMPPFSGLPDNPKFPDPFTFMDGTRMTTKAQWKCRHAEIAALAQEFELGYMQDTPYSATTGSFVDGNKITVDVNDNGEEISFTCTITYPGTGSPPYPAMIGMLASFLNNSQLSSMGVAVINFPTDEIAQQDSASSRGIGKFYDMYGSGHSAGALMAWAWGVDRLIDALEKTPAANIDPTRLAVTGCSRWGKGALVAGAFCGRIKLTIPQESGSGGAASWRVSQYQKDVLGQNVQTLSQIVTENCWFRSNFSQFGSAVNKLPFDHHMVAALCAPDALLFIENSTMDWLGNQSCWTTGNVTHMIYEGLEIPDRMGFSQVGNHNHCAFPTSQQSILNAYVQKFLIGGGTADTNVMYTDGLGLPFNPADWVNWVDWTAPDLESLVGDFDSSTGVNYMDFAILADAWLSDPVQPYWDQRCDIAEPPDDFIDFFDFGIFSQYWRRGLFSRDQ
ncbi:MAG: BACON domain-containing protein [Sedimentisphaerales bacterium]|nr:BACON domain-containing protein [Sedimentisphaerales bacterium]